MKIQTRIFALALAAAALFAACGPAGAGGESSSSAASSSAAVTSEAETEATAPETDEPMDVAGYRFTFTSAGYLPKAGADGRAENGVQQEFFDRIAALESRLGVVFETVSVDGLPESLTAANASGIKLADAVHANQTEYWPAARSGALFAADGKELSRLGLDCGDEGRWFLPAVESSRLFGGMAWGVQVASEYIPAPTGYFIVFNREIAASAGGADLYQKVRDKAWTWELYREIAKKATKDSDGDGRTDIWGTGATAWGNEAVTNGVNFVGEGGDGRWTLTIDSPEGIAALDFVHAINVGDGTKWKASFALCREGFRDGTVCFCWALMGHIEGPGQAIYDSGHDFGIIPMPMGPEADDYAAVANNNRLLVFQRTNRDIDKTVFILNEWADIANDTESYLKILGDGRCRTEADREMMAAYIIPKFKLNNAKMESAIWDAIDTGIVTAFCEEGLSVAEALDAQRDTVNLLLDEFLNR